MHQTQSEMIPLYKRYVDGFEQAMASFNQHRHRAPLHRLSGLLSAVVGPTSGSRLFCSSLSSRCLLFCLLIREHRFQRFCGQGLDVYDNLASPVTQVQMYEISLRKVRPLLS